MDRENSGEIEADDLNWRDRCEYWLRWQPKVRGRRKIFRYREPLLLAGHGIRIQVHRNTLLIRPGLTHFPQKIEELRFFPGDPNLPDRIIILDASGGISFDALSWMSDQKIALVQLNWRGKVSFSGNGGFPANPGIVKWQSEIQGTPKAGEINRNLICAKLEASIETLQIIFDGSGASKIAIPKIRDLSTKVKNIKPGNSKREILGYEGAAAAIYYGCWHGIPLKWASLSKRPVPSSWFSIGSRQMAWRKDGNNARHPINAMLNYGYGVVISQLRTDVISAGFDPSIGITHGRHTNPIPLVYDLMEPLRPVVDRNILEFALAHTFTPDDFTINSKGGCRLNPQLTRVVVRQLAEIECRSQIINWLA